MLTKPPEGLSGPPAGKPAEESERECVWMKAKVVNFKMCDTGFDCLNCAFDKAMRAAWNQEPETTGKPPRR
jgi:hypothetical protein